MRIPALLRTPRGLGAVLVVVAVLLRLPLLLRSPYPDEGGLLVVARHWAEGVAGPYLYGDLFVDRPPLLLLTYRLADALGGLAALRVLGLVAVAVLVAAACWAGHRIAGTRGLLWAGLVAGALAAHPSLGTRSVNAELLGAPYTMLALCCLVPLARGAGQRWPAFVAGVLGGCAVLVKQNIADALVFGVVLALVAALTRAWPWRRALAVVGLGVLGALVPIGLATAWAARGAGVGELWQTMYGFRIDSTRILAGESTGAPAARLVTLGEVALVSGMLVLAVATLWALRGRLRRADPLAVATVAMLLVEILGVLGGASFWTHYLIGLIPALVLLAALAAEAGEEPSAQRATKVAIAFTIVSSLIGIAVTASPWSPGTEPDLEATTTWIKDSSRPGDTIFVAFGQAQVVYQTGLEPGYSQMWSLPLRTLDPRFEGLVHTMEGPRAPTWFVVYSSLGSWGIDTAGRVQGALDSHYRLVGTVCGIQVWLHDGDRRPLSPAPTPSC